MKWRQREFSPGTCGWLLMAWMLALLMMEHWELPFDFLCCSIMCGIQNLHIQNMLLRLTSMIC